VFGYYNRDELIKLIHECDLYVHASDAEIEGISLIEAFACGLVPIIPTANRVPRRSLRSVPRIFQSRVPESLAEKIDYWLDHPEQLKEAEKKYAQLGKQYALEHSIRK